MTGDGAAGHAPHFVGGDGSANRVGHYRWLEAALFEVLGQWSAEVGPDEARIVFRESSYHHAWHVQLWDERLSALGVADPSPLTVPPGGGGSALMADLRSMGFAEAGPFPGTGPVTTGGLLAAAERLAAVFRVVLPRLLTACGAHLSAASPVSDGPLLRVLRIVVADLTSDWLRGELALESIFAGARANGSSPQDVGARVSTVTARLEATLDGQWLCGAPLAPDMGCRDPLTAPLLWQN